MAQTVYRLETDFIGSRELPIDALYGIHSLRAKENFPDSTRFHIEWFKAIATVKKACYLTAKDFFEQVSKKNIDKDLDIKSISPTVLSKMILATTELEQGGYFSDFIVPAISGGAGTSINLNVNEIIANRSLQLLGKQPGDYSIIDPFEDANIFQSTNDVIPTALRLTLLSLFVGLEEAVNNLRQVLEGLEQKHKYHIRKAYTQLQEAVPSSFGRLFGAYNDALSRDWWRISKCIERIKVVNLGGSAIGSGVGVPRYFMMEVVKNLQEITKLPITKSENLYDATSNLDSFVEAHGIFKTLAVNLEKMSADLRLLSSDIHDLKEITIPEKQVGSSIMPGKVNPVIPEFVISCSHKVFANDALITNLCAQGNLELNAYIPTIGHAFIESVKLLTASCNSLQNNLFSGLTVNEELAAESLYKSTSITTILVPFIGYKKAAELAHEMKRSGVTIFKANENLDLINAEKLIILLKPENILKEGFILKDIQE